MADTCDLLEDCTRTELARYRVWLVGPHPDGPCDGHPACPTCTARARAGVRRVRVDRVETLEASRAD